MQSADVSTDDCLHTAALRCLRLASAEEKCDAVQSLVQRWHQGGLQRDVHTPIQRLEVPGRPQRPLLVHPARVPKRSFDSAIGRVRLAHAIAHIEFNAINLALDAVYRFRDQPHQYYTDWLQVAAEEAEHFSLLQQYLRRHDSYYGQYSAHNGLWEMALKTDHDVLVRMALVPRVLEARGLDVTPGMIRRLQAAGDEELVAILQRIFDDEIGHVRIGSHWFFRLCEQRGLDAEETFVSLLQQYMQQGIAGPFEMDARMAAGFTEQEMLRLRSLSVKRKVCHS